MFIIKDNFIDEKKLIKYLDIFQDLSEISVYLIFFSLFLIAIHLSKITINFMFFTLILTIVFYSISKYLKLKKRNYFKKLFGIKFFEFVKSNPEAYSIFKRDVKYKTSYKLLANLIEFFLGYNVIRNYRANNLKAHNVNDSLESLKNTFFKEKKYGNFSKDFIFSDKNPNRLTIVEYSIEFIVTMVDLCQNYTTDKKNKNQYAQSINECTISFFEFVKNEENKFIEYIMKNEVEEQINSLDNSSIDRAKKLNVVLNELKEI